MQLHELETNLKTATSITAVNQVLTDYLEKLGIKTFAYTYYSRYPNSFNKLKYDYATKDYLNWHQHYIDEGYEDVDSTLDDVQHTILPTFWNLKQQLKNAKTDREKQMRLDSIAFGVEQGLSIPIYGPDEDFAVLLLVQKRGEKCLEHWQKLQHELFVAGHFYYHYLQLQLLQQHKKSNRHTLNKREIECLTFMAKNFSVPNIAKKLNITPRTVHYYSQRINKKLGTKNKYQSVIKAMQKGFITL